jgi:hypothetical protein
MEVNILTYNTHGLPWSRDTKKEITAWIVQKQPDILCLQEVFTLKARHYYVKMLFNAGYTIITPNDQDVTVLPSGLLTGFKTSAYSLTSHVFCPYLSYHNVEALANKGFHLLRLQSRKGLHIQIVNTHTQSNTEVSWWFGDRIIDIIRREQFQQILDFVHGVPYPVLICGDVNCPRSPHSDVRFLTPIHQNLVQKATFYSTGEDLDNVGWILPQYAPKGCELCDVERFGPILTNCEIFQLPYSDHAPVLFDIVVPFIR